MENGPFWRTTHQGVGGKMENRDAHESPLAKDLDLFHQACDLADEMMRDLPRRAGFRRVWQANVLDIFGWLRERRAAGNDPLDDETRSMVHAFRRRLLYPLAAK